MDKTKKYKWYKIAAAEMEIRFNVNNLFQTEIAGKKICIARVDKKLFATTNNCPHAGGIIADGFIDTLGNIVCPLHRYKFNLQTGRDVTGEGYYLKIYPIEIRDEGIFVGIDESGTFSWLK